jgi:hypothetical protein
MLVESPKKTYAIEESTDRESTVNSEPEVTGALPLRHSDIPSARFINIMPYKK